MSLKIGYQGEPGAYSEHAIISKFGEDTELKNFNTFTAVFRAVESGNIDLGVVPIENFMAGSINKTYDLLLQHNLFITGEVFLKIHHCLIGTKDSTLDGIKRVYSHPQALEQCAEFLDKHEFEYFATNDTAGSVRKLKENPDPEEAAIASKRAAEHYGLKVLKEGIETAKNNVTRFIIISKEEAHPDDDCKSSLVFAVRDIPAALYKCLGGFATNSINLVKLESRPARDNHGKYMFYLDFEGSKDNTGVKNALQELEFFTEHVKFLGSYPAGKKD